MNFNELRQEAQLLFSVVNPILQMTDEEFGEVVIHDLTVIGVLCGAADGELSSGEAFIYASVLVLINQDHESARHLNLWEQSEEVRVAYQSSVVNLFNQLVESNNYQLYIPSLLKRIDEANSTNLFEPVANALYRFAQVIVRADDNISISEVESLSLVWSLINQEDEADKTDMNEGTIALEASTDNETLETVLNELQQLVGMQNVKKEVCRSHKYPYTQFF